MNTGCGLDHDRLVEHAAGRLTGLAAERVKRHLEACETCRADLTVIEAVRGAPISVPAGLESRIKAAVRNERPAARAVTQVGVQPSRRRSWRAWGVPLAAAAALVAFLMVGQGEPGSPAESLASEEYAPYGAWPGSDGVLAGDVVLSELSVEELERLLEEMES